jgi:hypothetical protein
VASLLGVGCNRSNRATNRSNRPSVVVTHHVCTCSRVSRGSRCTHVTGLPKTLGDRVCTGIRTHDLRIRAQWPRWDNKHNDNHETTSTTTTMRQQADVMTWWWRDAITTWHSHGLTTWRLHDVMTWRLYDVTPSRRHTVTTPSCRHAVTLPIMMSVMCEWWVSRVNVTTWWVTTTDPEPRCDGF